MFPVPLEGDDISELIERYRDQLPMNEHMVTMDPPEHTRQRALLMRLLSPKRLKQNEEFMWRYADRQLDEFLADGHCEFISAYSQPFAMLVVADLLGVPESDFQRFREGFGLSKNPGDLSADDGGGLNALDWCDEYFTTYIEDRRREPRADVLTDLALAKYPDGTTPDVTAVVRTATFLFAAGQETTARLLAIALKYLCEYPELQDELREHRERIPDFIDECLRIESPVKADFRLARRATTVGGVTIEPGTPVMLLNGAANRDPRRFEDPAEFRIDRPEHQGAHRLRARAPRVPRWSAGARRGPHQRRAHPRPHARHPALRGAPRSSRRPPVRLRADVGPARPPRPPHRVHAGRRLTAARLSRTSG